MRFKTVSLNVNILRIENNFKQKVLTLNMYIILKYLFKVLEGDNFEANIKL